MPPYGTPWYTLVYTTLYTHHTHPGIYHPVHPGYTQHASRAGRAGTAVHGPSADRGRAPGLWVSETRGWAAFCALGSAKVSAFLWDARADHPFARARTDERLDSARVIRGAGPLGTAPRARRHPIPGYPRARACARRRSDAGCVCPAEDKGEMRRKGAGPWAQARPGSSRNNRE